MALGESRGFRNAFGRVDVASGGEKLMGEFRKRRVVCQDKRVAGFHGPAWREKAVRMRDAGNTV